MKEASSAVAGALNSFAGGPFSQNFQSRILWLQGFAEQALRVVDRNIEEGTPSDRPCPFAASWARGMPDRLLGGRSRCPNAMARCCSIIPSAIRYVCGISGPLPDAEQLCDIPALRLGLPSGRAYPRRLPALVPSHQPPPSRRLWIMTSLLSRLALVSFPLVPVRCRSACNFQRSSHSKDHPPAIHHPSKSPRRLPHPISPLEGAGFEPSVPPQKDVGCRFAHDSALEQAGFELSVPPKTPDVLADAGSCEAARRDAGRRSENLLTVIVPAARHRPIVASAAGHGQKKQSGHSGTSAGFLVIAALSFRPRSYSTLDRANPDMSSSSVLISLGISSTLIASTIAVGVTETPHSLCRY